MELLERWDYGGVFLLSALDRVTISLIPSEVLLPLYGFLVRQGSFSFLPTFLIISVGSLLGEAILYWIFAWGGRWFFEKYGKYFWVYKHDLEHLDRLFSKHGAKFVFWGRFLPFARSIIAIPAGISRLGLRRFLIYSFLGMLPYNLLLIFLGYKIGENFGVIRPYLDVTEKIGIFVVMAFVTWYVYRHLEKRHATHH